ncbi:MAG TPA: hypothetical protein VH054_05645, partial [Polyangiaceae bacterium]|nr:hypothetical protein [Polyangiaceae bacterium]
VVIASCPMVRGLIAIVFLTGCATYTSELERGQQAFEKNEHERALAVFRALEPDQSHFDPPEEAKYAYLRGMTDYRIGYRADARHWLAVAKAIDDKNPDSIPADWKNRLTPALAELNDEVYGGGMAALGNDGKKAHAKDEPKRPVKKSEDEP